MFHQAGENGWGDEEDYYNDCPGAEPPSPSSPLPVRKRKVSSGHEEYPNISHKSPHRFSFGSHMGPSCLGGSCVSDFSLRGFAKFKKFQKSKRKLG